MRAALVIALAPVAASVAFAQPDPKGDKPPEEVAPPTPEQLEAAKKAYLEGAALYQAGEKAAAVEKFKESYRLSRNPVLLYNIGVTLDELKELDKAKFYYEKFLKDAPKDAAQRAEVTKRLPKLVKELEAIAKTDAGKPDGGVVTPPDGGKPDGGVVTPPDGGKPDGGVVTPPDGGAVTPPDGGHNTADGGAVTPPDGAKPDAFMHTVVEEAPPDTPLDITCFVPEDSGWQVTLFYRSAKELKFHGTSMRPRYNELVGRIPAKTMKGVSVQYYIEVRDSGGATVAKSGKATSPNLVFIEADAKPRFYPDVVEERDWEVKDDTIGDDGKPKPIAPVKKPTGFLEVGSSKFKYSKWTATGLAAASLTGTIVFYLSAANAASELEAEIERSGDSDTCDPGLAPPCVTYTDRQKDIEAYGRRYETLTNVALVTGIITTGVASYFWYKEIRASRQETPTRPAGASVQIAPVVTGDYIGGAAALRF